MKEWMNKVGWIINTVLGGAIFALGFDLFLLPHGLNTGGVSGLSMVLIEILGFGSVGVLQVIINVPLFLVGGVKIGKKFFVGSLIGMASSSVFIDLFSIIPVPNIEVLLAIVYGAALCGLGIGMVLSAGTSTGGSEIVVRLLKLKWRNVSVGAFSLAFDLLVAVLTGLVFRDVTKTLYTGITVFITSQVLDVVVYRFDYSKVAMVITKEYQQVAQQIGQKLQRGVTLLHGEGGYSHQETKVILTAVKRRQLAELKELVTEIDPDAFVIVQEAHQVLGDGFAKYSKDSL